MVKFPSCHLERSWQLPVNAATLKKMDHLKSDQFDLMLLIIHFFLRKLIACNFKVSP